MSSSWGAAWSASTPPRSRPAWGPKSPSWMSIWSACGIWTTCCPRTSRPTFSNPLHIREILPSADVVIGAVLIKGARAPILVSQADLKRMKPGSVIVDVAVDQGGCIETMHPTTHAVPVFTVDEVVHYGVANIPGAVPGDLDLRPDQRHFPLPAGPRQQGRQAGAAGRRWAGEGPERRRRRVLPVRSRRGVRPAPVHRRGVAGLRRCALSPS